MHLLPHRFVVFSAKESGIQWLVSAHTSFTDANTKAAQIGGIVIDFATWPPAPPRPPSPYSLPDLAPHLTLQR